MLQRLRSDLRQRLSQIRLLFINADGFLSENRVKLYPHCPPEQGNGHEIFGLSKIMVGSEAYSRGNPEGLGSIITRLGVEVYHKNIARGSVVYSKLKLERSVSDSEIAFIPFDISDITVIEKAGFSVAPADAPLEVKAKSHYVAYGAGEQAVREAAGLILRAKSDPLPGRRG